MFSSALKSFSSNITANYEISKQPSATAGVWRIFDGKKKSTGSQASIFMFERKSLETNSSSFGSSRSSASSLKKVHDEVIDRLKREASNLARLRHPSILQLAEPVEDTRGGGLMFATEPITASLSGLLAEKNDQDRSGGSGGRSSRYVVEDENGNSRSRDVEMDDLEIQKGLLQIAKGLEFLHESAKLVHGNLTPDAIYVNSKGDWKLAGLAFAGPPDTAEGHQTLPTISLSEALYHDPRLPRNVQISLDFSSPDFVLDQNVSVSADMYSLGLIAVALYSYPHTSPIEAHGNQSTYKKLLGNSTTTPSPSNSFLSTRNLPRELSQTLTRLLARRPAQRLTAREFQESEYFDNLLMKTIRFLDAFPAKTPSEKAQFMRGLGRVMPQFPPSVLGKKVLGVVLDEMKDHELLSIILQNVFAILKIIPFRKQAFQERVIPKFRETFLTKSSTSERDAGKEAGLMIILQNMESIAEHCSAKEFKDDILPIVLLGMESPTHPLVDASLKSLGMVLPVLDFTTVKHDLFPVVATVVSKTSSLGIKVSGLEALVVLCGGHNDSEIDADDELMIQPEAKKSSSANTGLDKFTVQEKVVPVLKAIKTKEPAVMMAALGVFRQVGKIADTDFIAMDVLPTLWSFSLGPLLNLQQFQAFMDLIKTLSTKVETEQIRKLQELGSTGRTETIRTQRTKTTGELEHTNGTNGTAEDFERLVLGNAASKDPFGNSSQMTTPSAQTQAPPAFSWSSSNTSNVLQPQQPTSRSITPDSNFSPFPSLKPSNIAGPTSVSTSASIQSSAAVWGNTAPLQPQRTTSNPTLASLSTLRNAPLSGLQNATFPPNSSSSTFTIPPPPSSPWGSSPPQYGQTMSPMIPGPGPSRVLRPSNQYAMPPIQATNSFGQGMAPLQPSQLHQQPSPPPQQQRSGLDKYTSLL